MVISMFTAFLITQIQTQASYDKKIASQRINGTEELCSYCIPTTTHQAQYLILYCHAHFGPISPTLNSLTQQGLDHYTHGDQSDTELTNVYQYTTEQPNIPNSFTRDISLNSIIKSCRML